MIKYSLICNNDHAFEGWFSDSIDYEEQCNSGLLACPVCNSMDVQKTLMAPSVSIAKKHSPEPQNNAPLAPMASNANIPEKYAEAMSQLRELRTRVMTDAEDVGKKFPEEARKIHYGETKKRGIYGQASSSDVESLVDEGIEIVPLPVLPEDNN